MASPKVKPEGKKTAERVTEFMDGYSFGPIRYCSSCREAARYFADTGAVLVLLYFISDLDERGELHEACKEYAGMNGATPVKDMARRIRTGIRIPA